MKEKQVHILIGCADARDLNQIQLDAVAHVTEECKTKRHRCRNAIENPFENTFNDTPMNSICRTVENNLRQMLGEKELPKAVEAVNGFLF